MVIAYFGYLYGSDFVYEYFDYFIRVFLYINSFGIPTCMFLSRYLANAAIDLVSIYI